MSWLNARVLLVLEPLAVAVLCMWLGYGALDEFGNHFTEAAVFGLLLGVSCLANAAALAAGLAWGGAWRELPTSVSWHVSHAIEILPTLLHTSLLSQWAYRIDRLTSTPVWALLYFIAYIAHSTHVQIRYVMVATFFIFGHQCALVAYGAMTLPNWSSPQNGGNLRWVNTVFVMGGITLNFLFIWAFAMPVVESKRFEDFRVHSRAKLLHDVAHGLVSNFLPAPVLKAVQDRAGNTSGGGKNDSEIVAWAYDPACVLQSDICGFTALGSRITPNELCGCGSKSDVLSQLFNRCAEPLSSNALQTSLFRPSMNAFFRPLRSARQVLTRPLFALRRARGRERGSQDRDHRVRGIPKTALSLI